jgi:hypothetical protein
LYFIYYIRWLGTSGEFEKYLRRVENIIKGIEGVNYRGVFIPSSEWNFAFLLETSSFDQGIEIYKTYIKKYEGQNPLVLVEKLELLFTLEEIGFSE